MLSCRESLQHTLAHAHMRANTHTHTHAHTYMQPAPARIFADAHGQLEAEIASGSHVSGDILFEKSEGLGPSRLLKVRADTEVCLEPSV